MFLSRLKTVLSQPGLAREYAEWSAKSLVSGGNATRRLYGTIEIGDFANFSEYHKVKQFVDDPELQFFRHWEFGPGVFIDIGANLGVISLLIAARLAEARIFAIEPNPSTFTALKANIARNKAHRIVPKEIAISHADGKVSFDADPKNRGTASISLDGRENQIVVPSLTLDSFVIKEQIEKIALLKVDVEGFETLVFNGAENVLKRHVAKLILFEVCPEWTRAGGFDPTLPAEILMSAGYRLLRIGGDGRWRNAQVNEIPDVSSENWLAVPQ